MNVEKSHAVAFLKRFSIDVREPPPYFSEPSDQDVTGYQRVRHSWQFSPLQINVRSTDLAQLDFQKRRIRLQFWFGKFTNFNQGVGSGNYSRLYF